MSEHTAESDARYPTKWKRTTMRGCHPGCQAMHVPVESRITSPTAMETRHTDSHEPCPTPGVLAAPTSVIPPAETEATR